MKRISNKYIISALTLVLCAGIASSTAMGRQRGHFRIALVGDPQVNDSTEMSYARKSIYRELAERKDIDFALFLGDLVNDNMSLLPESVRIIDSLPYPCMMIPGNHDRDIYSKEKGSHSTRARDLTTWKSTVGYVDTAFVIGKTRFILMNNVRARNGGMADYEGGITECQRHWLDSVLNKAAESSPRNKTIQKTSLTILATHIPFSQMKGQDSILAMIPDACKLLFVSGHTHSVARGEISIASPDGISANAEEVIVGATCGSWWRGVKDGYGIPYAVQNCGAPRGYFIADIHSDERYDLDYKCVGRPGAERLSVWLVEDTEHCTGSLKDTENIKSETGNSRAFRLYTNVYGGTSNGNVDIIVPQKVRSLLLNLGIEQNSEESRAKDSTGRNARARHLCCSVSDKTAPEVMEIIDLNASTSREYRKAHRDEFIPLRKKPSPHLWESECFSVSPDKLQSVSESATTGQRKVAFYVTVRYQDPAMRIRQQRVPVYIY